MDRKEQTCCFTGHRKLVQGQISAIQQRLESAIVELINNGIVYFGAGGALGFDTLAAQTVLKLKKLYPKIRLILVLPCANQSRGWDAEDIRIYEKIKAQADKVVCLADRYFHGCMHERNRHLVDHSGYCICYLTGASGGTAYTVSYAQSRGLTITNVATSGGEEY